MRHRPALAVIALLGIATLIGWQLASQPRSPDSVARHLDRDHPQLPTGTSPAAANMQGKTNANTVTTQTPVAGDAIDTVSDSDIEAERKLAALLDKRLSPAMRAEINTSLRPNDSAPRVKQGRYGTYIDLSDRASSVLVAVIDDDGATVVTDIMHPLPDANGE